MSIGNLKDQGGKGNNFPFQYRMLSLLATINESIIAAGMDFVTRTTSYNATANGPGYVIGDILVRYDIIDVATSAVISTIWFNQTQGTNLPAPPIIGTYTPITAPSTVFVGNGVGGGAVNIQDGGNSITVDDGGGSLTVDGTVTVVPSGTQDVNIVSTIAVPITDNGGSLTVDATNLDIRDLTFATDKVDTSGSNVNAVVTATNLDIRNLTFADDKVDVSGSSVKMQDGSGNALTSTVVGGDTALDVNIVGGVTLEVNLDAANDQVGIYGYTNISDPSTYKAVKVDTNGALAVQDNGGSITVDGTVNIGTMPEVEIKNDSGNPIPVTGTVIANATLSGNSDYFNQLITVNPYNQVELRGDKLDYSDYINESATAGASINQVLGLIVFNSGTNTIGSATALSVDTLQYRPGNEIYAAGTIVFDAGVVGNTRRIGISDDLSFTNSITFGYEDTIFKLRYTRNSLEILNLSQASWTDPCNGNPGSLYTSNGIPVPINFQNGNIFRIRAGLFGFAGWIAEVFSPDRKWVKIYEYVNINNANTPIFTNNDFKLIFYNVNSGNTTNVAFKTQCWMGGSTSKVEKISESISDRTLAETVRSVISGRSSTGGGTYVNVKVNPSGSLEVNSNQGTSPWIIDTTATVRIPGLIRATGVGNIAAGARSISVYNAGNSAGSILGGVNNILPGEILNFSAGGENDTLSIFAYDGTGTTLVISTIV